MDGDVLVHGKHLVALLALAERADERQLLVAATQSVLALLGGERGSCVLLEPHARVVLSTAAPSLTDWPIDLARYPEIVLALEQQTIVAIDNVHEHPLLAPVRALLPKELRSVAVVPLFAAEKRWGVFIAQSSAPLGCAIAERATALLIGQLTAPLLELARLRVRELSTPQPLGRAPAGAAGRVLTEMEPDRTARTGRPRRILIVEDDFDIAAELIPVLN